MYYNINIMSDLSYFIQDKFKKNTCPGTSINNKCKFIFFYFNHNEFTMQCWHLNVENNVDLETS